MRVSDSWSLLETGLGQGPKSPGRAVFPHSLEHWLTLALLFLLLQEDQLPEELTTPQAAADHILKKGHCL